MNGAAVVVRTPSGKKAHLTDNRAARRCYCGAPFSDGFDLVEIVASPPSDSCSICRGKWNRLHRK